MFNKKFLVLLLAFIMISSVLVNADTEMIKDLDKSSGYAKDSISYLVEQNIIKGDNLGNYNPQKTVTRAEMVALLARVFNLDTASTIETATFKDVPKENWANPYVEAAFKEGIVTGVSTTEFKPNAMITREQMAVMFVRALKLVDKDTTVELKNLKDFTDNNKISSWAQKEVEVALEAQLMNGMTSKTFEPGSFAKKEQAAVVIERLMKNKVNIIEAFKTISPQENSVKLIVNGEAVILKNAPIVKDSNVYVSTEFFNKYILAVRTDEIAQDAKDIELPLDEEYQSKGDTVLWLQVDNTNAYRNVEENPFANMDNYKDKLIQLKLAPISENGVTYIPLEDLSDILDLTYNYDEAANTLTVNGAKIGKSAALYYALKNLAYTNFLGEIRAKGDTEIDDINNNFKSVDSFDMRDRLIDPKHGEFYTKYTYKENNDLPQTAEEHVIKVNDNQYTHDYSDNKWAKEVKPYDSWIGVTLYDPLYDNNEISQIDNNRTLFNNIHKLDIKNEGAVNLSGINATKYVIELDLDGIKNIMTDEEYAELRPLIASDLRGDFKYVHEFYVAKDKVIKQSYSFLGEFKDSETGSPIDIKSSTVMYYNKLPRDFKVVEPAAPQVK